MTKWWLQIPLVDHIIGLKKTEQKYLKLIDNFASEILEKRKVAVNVDTNEDTMGVIDRYILSGELNEQEIKWETFTLFTTVSHQFTYTNITLTLLSIIKSDDSYIIERRHCQSPEMSCNLNISCYNLRTY